MFKSLTWSLRPSNVLFVAGIVVASLMAAIWSVIWGVVVVMFLSFGAVLSLAVLICLIPMWLVSYLFSDKP